jgi:epoxide hydrolase-like predicted phosphatase
MPIKALIWDIGGVLVRTIDPGPRTCLAERLGVSSDQLEKIVFEGETGFQAQLGEISAEEQWRSAASQLGLPADAVPGLRDAFFGGDRLDTALVDTIRELHQHYRTGIISNALDNTRGLLEDTWHIADAFDHIILSAEVGVMKPDARIFQLALQGLNVAAQEAVFVDDYARNVQGAQAVGLHAIHFKNPQQALQELYDLL